jgi:hypothetical protein
MFEVAFLRVNTIHFTYGTAKISMFEVAFLRVNTMERAC